MNQTAIARNARELRTASKLTLQAVEARGGPSASYLSRIERGVGPKPSRDVLVSLCEVFGCTLARLVGRDIERPMSRSKAQQRRRETERAVQIAAEKAVQLAADRVLVKSLHTRLVDLRVSMSNGRHIDDLADELDDILYVLKGALP